MGARSPRAVEALAYAGFRPPVSSPAREARDERGLSGHRSETMIRRTRGASDGGRSRRHHRTGARKGRGGVGGRSLLMASSRWTHRRSWTRPAARATTRRSAPTRTTSRRRSCRARRASAARTSSCSSSTSSMGSTALALTEKSVLRRKLGEFPPEALRYFEPAPAPEWLDEAKLRAGRHAVARQLARLRGGPLRAVPARLLPVRGGGPGPLRDGRSSRTASTSSSGSTRRGLFADDVLDVGGFQVARGLHPGALPRGPAGRRPRGRLDGRARRAARAREPARPSPGLGARVAGGGEDGAGSGSCGAAGSWPPGRCASCTRRSASCS